MSTGYRRIHDVPEGTKALVTTDDGRVFYNLDILAQTFADVAATVIPLNGVSDDAADAFAAGILKVVDDIRDSLSFIRTVAE